MCLRRPFLLLKADLRQRLGGIALERIWFHPQRRAPPQKRTLARTFSTVESTLVRADQSLDGGTVLPPSSFASQTLLESAAAS